MRQVRMGGQVLEPKRSWRDHRHRQLLGRRLNLSVGVVGMETAAHYRAAVRERKG